MRSTRSHLFNTYYTDRIEGLELYKGNQDIANVADSLDIQNMINVKIS
jgi:hypothetical protein